MRVFGQRYVVPRRGRVITSLLVWGLVAGLAQIASPAFATSVGAAKPIRFDITSQPLVAALEVYSVVTDVQVLYDSRLASGRQSTAVQGMFTPDAALQRLLEGTGLTIQYTSSNDVVLTRPSATSPYTSSSPARGPVLALDTLHVEAAADAGDESDFRAYAGIVQADIQDALHRDSGSRLGSYRIGMKLWVNQSGAIRRAEIVRSTGDPERDLAISRVLREVKISKAPPTGMPQPMAIVIVARSL